MYCCGKAGESILKDWGYGVTGTDGSTRLLSSYGASPHGGGMEELRRQAGLLVPL